MNTELIKRNECTASTSQIDELAQATGLHKKLCELLICRGFCTKEAVRKLFEPSISDFYDPFMMEGVSEAVERIERAIKNKETIVVYGDYDADGICASAILSLYLMSKGLNIYTHIPSRISEGYGLSIESLEKIIDSFCPDLIITCDCGISAHAEVEFAQDLGVDIIVTDHHEIAGELPSCVCVNPKRADCKYPIDNLCGAGVALKLIEALGGIEAASQYFDLAMVATIADLVPLLDENRLIVQMGLKNIKNKGLKALLKNQQVYGAVTSSDIAFKVAPRINAAGRMGDAYRAFELLVLDDDKKIEAIIEDINEDNQKRKALCDELYNEAVEGIKNENIIENRAIILTHPSWEKGITGILAARLAGDFRRPSFILVGASDVYKGTCRSVSGINIYELLVSVGDLLVEFGGHSQAAGFSIKQENIHEFKKRINKKLEDYEEKLFLPTFEYDLDISLEEVDTSLCKALELLEPIGNSNPRPIFRTSVERVDISVCKSNYNHTNISAQNLSMIAFNFYNENQFLLGEEKKDLAIELQINTFNHKESPRAVLRAVSPKKLFIQERTARSAYIKSIQKIPHYKSDSPVFSYYQQSELGKLLEKLPIYGTLIICGCQDSYKRVYPIIKDKNILHEFMYPTTKNNFSRIIVAPMLEDTILLSNYDRIIFIDSPIGSGTIPFLNKFTKARIYVPQADNEKEFFEGIDISREAFILYFDAIKKNSHLSSINVFSYFKLLSNCVPSLQLCQFIVSCAVFEELNLITISDSGFGISINCGTKNELTNSLIYQYIKERVS